LTDISSIAFQEDFVTWTELTVDDKVINIKRAVSDSLPVSINFQSLKQPNVAEDVAAQLRTLVELKNLKTGKTRVTIPGRFAVIKKIVVDKSIPENQHQGLVNYEFQKSWKEDPQNYTIFLTNYKHDLESMNELLAVGIRKEVLKFFESVLEKAQLDAVSISPNCFTVDEFFRALHPNVHGDCLILGWQRRGYDVIVSNSQNFVNYSFRPYNSNLDPIEQIEEEELISGFDVLLEEIKHPPVVEKPLYDIQSVYFYGFHFKPAWLELMGAQVHTPLHLLNLDGSDSFRLAAESKEISAKEVFQIFEPISNIF